MLNIAEIKNGIVIDHIKAGQGIRIFNWLGLGKASYPVAFVVNASSDRMGRKDLIKIDNTITINFDILGLIDPNITVNIIENEAVTEKIKLKLPRRVEDILICKNPRCITSTEKYIPHIFHLDNPEQGAYRCEYCDEVRSAEDFR
ncbi:MAG: aspartate carbamoyltransferase regulatory subunit [Treponema sp.]|jgi:aspartate carbamoyltransferase regulatory subunit|nr:aspartate carbamoyltransferase regulatory subunit [Treponema sp.]